MRKSNYSGRRRPLQSFKFVSMAVAAIIGALSATVNAQPPPAPERGYNYGLALQMSIYFLDIQRSGLLPSKGNGPDQYRVPWRFDSALEDGADHGVDLTGGYYDAGDYVKFVFPMAASMTDLAWSVIEYEDGFRRSGQLPYMLSALRWGTDFLIKAHAAPHVLYAQVGLPALDHRYWGPPENMTMARPSFKITEHCPGSDLAGEVAAALAASSLVFRDKDPDYADLLLDHAEDLYAFADQYRGVYSACVSQAAPYYASRSGYEDELAWGAAWMFRATGDRHYLQLAESWFPRISGAYRWTHCWDDKRYGTYVLLATMTGKTAYRRAAEAYLDYWTIGYGGERVRYTRGGLAWLDRHGPLRYAANTALMAFIYSDWLRQQGPSNWRSTTYHDFAARQVDYILGDNPEHRSYMVGFGVDPPRTPHHRASYARTYRSGRGAQRYIAYGAMVGGPDADDRFVDNRSDYRSNEVALDYNACLTGALARMTEEFGGAPLAVFPPEPSPVRVAVNP